MMETAFPKFSRLRSASVWMLAVLVTLFSAVYQRLSGPTCPYRGIYVAERMEWRYRLTRNPQTDAPMAVSLPAPQSVSGSLIWREYPTERSWKSVTMIRAGDRLSGEIPVQPTAGKVEYYLVLTSSGDAGIRIPEDAGSIVARFKNPVPAWALIPHIILMFMAMLLSNRVGIGLALRERLIPARVIAVFVSLTLGGLVLGPIVQWHAFGAAWTGWPVGHDLTDNKSAILWLAWLIPVVSVIRRRDPRRSTLFASILMFLIYMIPHSLMGSEHSYRD